MKQKALIIGSTAVDVIIEIEKLPRTGDDVNTKSRVLNVGGCAYNVASMLSYLSKDFDLISPVGSGYFGDFVNKTLALNGFSAPLARVEAENGCCYCFVENNGERSFVCHRGAEYVFRDEFFESVDPSKYEVIYFCGLDVTGEKDDPIIKFLERAGKAQRRTDKVFEKGCELKRPAIFFAPGPQINSIPKAFLRKIFNLNPIIHLSKSEYAVLIDMFGSGEDILEMTKAPLIITQGSNGASIIMPNKDRISKVHIPAHPVENLVDTIGAGDAHAGALISSMLEGKSLSDAVAFANVMSAKVVETKGSTLLR